MTPKCLASNDGIYHHHLGSFIGQATRAADTARDLPDGASVRGLHFSNQTKNSEEARHGTNSHVALHGHYCGLRVP